MDIYAWALIILLALIFAVIAFGKWQDAAFKRMERRLAAADARQRKQMQEDAQLDEWSEHIRRVNPTYYLSRSNEDALRSGKPTCGS